MPSDPLSASASAARLGISVATLYDWLGQSDRGLLQIRGQKTSISYWQGGPKGQGRIRIAASEVERLMDLMLVRPCPLVVRPPRIQRASYPGITVPLGRPPA